MRVLLLADVHSSHVLKWVSGLKSIGVEIALFSLTPMSDDVAHYYKDVSTTCMKNDFATGRVELKILYLRAVPKIKSIIKSFKPDVVHAHYASSYGLLGALSGFNNYCISVWGTDVYVYPKSGKVYRKLLEYSLSKAAVVFSTSKDMARETMQYTHHEPQVIPFGVDIEKFKPAESKNYNGVLNFATTKSLRSVYNIPLVVKVFNELVHAYPNQNLNLHIAGDGDEMEDCRKMAGDGIAKSIFFNGAIPHSDMPQFLSDKHVLVNIPDSESFGVGIVEASVAELAIIGTNSGGIPEVVIDGQTGILIDYPEEKLLRAAMVKMIENRDLIQEMAIAGSAFAKREYDWKSNLNTQYQSYLKLLNISGNKIES